MNSLLYALDFDGVLCDSAQETGLAGWLAAGRLWPGFSGSPQPELLDAFRRVRPALETGYEAVLIMRLLKQGYSAETLLADYAGHLQQALAATGMSQEALKQAFAQTRDRWIAEQPEQWLALNPLFPGVVETLRTLRQLGPCYLVTTKQARFAQRILAGQGVDWPMSEIFGLERKLPKTALLRELQAAYPGHVIHFLEDRLAALLSVKACPELAGVALYLADWGYNTESERGQARQADIAVISLLAWHRWADAAPTQ
ncbi:MAG: HAD family hydrolase [Methylococcales bacterium]|nr:HAD family hydrolase [Methylococcales bacterium]